MRCRLFAIRLGIAALVLCSISGYLHSTTVRLLTTGEMVADSNLIIIGKVTGKSSRWNNRHTFIVTDYRIAVEERALVQTIGAPYSDYMKRTYRLIPFVL